LAALKEWSIVCNALGDGRQCILFRKGGILEYKQGFEVKHESFFLYPTLEHQSRQYIQKDYVVEFDRLISECDSARVNDEVILKLWAKVERIHRVSNLGVLDKIEQYHIWNRNYLQLRMNYNPSKPLFLLLVRVYTLIHPLKFQILPAWSGCKSWIDIHVPEYESIGNCTAINKLDLVEPVLNDSDFENISCTLEDVLT